MDNINAFKAVVTGVFVAVSAMLGWFGWLVVIFISCLAGDWISGSAAAVKTGEWSSKIGREGIWHKAGCIVVVLVAAVLDGVVGSIVNNISAVSLPFTYSVLLCPVVLV